MDRPRKEIMKVLIAEDDLDSNRIVESMLRNWDYDIVSAYDGDAAWNILQQQDAPKLILLDWNLQGTDGIEICRRLRVRDNPNPPYILLIGCGEKSDIVQGLQAGANDYVTKPYDNEELQARIGVGRRMLELQANLLQARDALEHLATHDPLTGVFNRRAILDRLKTELSRAKRENGNLSIGMCDIDYFKMVNGTHGHLAGDRVLIAFTQCIQSHLRDYDCIGRYGGEEFLIIAPGPNSQSEMNLYERLRIEIAALKVETKTGIVGITTSIGVATMVGDGDVDAALADVDAALYQAKAAGRDRVVYRS
jgi:two-component system, cell cycle response regulator